MKPNIFCCERFKEFYNSGEIIYAYEKSNEIDETDWIVASFAHLYYCPFCGSFIKGKGFGTYDKKYPPNEKNRVIEQQNQKRETKKNS